MKRFIPVLFILFLFGIAGCAFAPADSTDYNAELEATLSGTLQLDFMGTTPNNWGRIQDTNNDDGDVQGEIYVYFNDYLDVSTVTLLNFDILVNGSSGFVDDKTIAYEKNFKRVKLTGVFAEDATYSLVIKGGAVKSISGSYLDGNGNGINDGSPYDDMTFQYYTGTGDAWADRTNPEIQYVSPMSVSNVNVDPNFEIWFTEVVESTDVVNNVKLIRESDGDEIDLDLIFYTGDYYVFEIADDDSLSERQFYTFEIACENITDSNDNACLHPNELYGSVIPNLESRFLTMSYHGDDDRAPWVNNINVGYGSFFMGIEFSEPMDISTLTGSSIKVFADYGNNAWEYVPGEIKISADSTTAEYSLINLNWDYVYDLKLFINKNVTDNSQKNWPLDNNYNGIGGESYDALRWDYENSDDFFQIVW